MDFLQTRSMCDGQYFYAQVALSLNAGSPVLLALLFFDRTQQFLIGHWLWAASSCSGAGSFVYFLPHTWNQKLFSRALALIHGGWSIETIIWVLMMLFTSELL